MVGASASAFRVVSNQHDMHSPSSKFRDDSLHPSRGCTRRRDQKNGKGHAYLFYHTKRCIFVCIYAYLSTVLCIALVCVCVCVYLLFLIVFNYICKNYINLFVVSNYHVCIIHVAMCNK